ncbi:hypothetical protein BO71DRAFT_484645 [Aspergillus ellipticus CBS 707.79]|uniref:AA9 family lytic polysaccharide monooxygenase n=1 Tax=Aspergillus ellipticus CBS 707.79 TaxID=1448320 RepID=A0A319DYR9_9EURO|nr:hypothetical protein BO71DRAFT_484645 [Aspergillus ellipticus CBS 707.79]
MKPSTYGMFALAAASKLVNAHTTVQAVWINGEDQGLGNTDSGYIRSPPSNSPVKDVTSTDMTCNVNGDQAAAKTLSVKSGDVVTFEWHHDSRSASDDIIASSHLGPVMVYMAPTTKGSAGSNWVRIAEDGYDDGTWAVTKLINNKGKHNITVPNVPAVLHGVRPFKVTSDGDETLPSGVSIPGAYSATDPGILFNLYGSFTTYPIPGPTVWSGASSGSSSSSSGSSSSAAAAASVAATPSTKAAVVASSSATSVAATSAVAPVEETSAPAAAAAPTYAASSVVVSSAQAYAPTTFQSSAKASPTACKSKGKGKGKGKGASQNKIAASSPVIPAPVASSSVVPSATPSASASAGGVAKKYQQCGGLNHSGPTTCESNTVCHQYNPYYSQCIESN